MAELKLRFLGQFYVSRDGRPITAFESNKVRALLAYLAVEAERVHTRGALTALLWPDYDEPSARGSLRQALYQLRQVLGDTDDSAALLSITRQTLQFNPAGANSLDVATFTTLLTRCASHAHPQLEQCPVCLQHMRQAVDLYQGDFLAGFTIDDSTGFEEWRRIKQEQLHLQALDTLALLANIDEVTGELARAETYARRQLTLEPWRETAHRQIMRLLARQGQRAAALAQYQQCRQVLAAELAVEPAAETTTLHMQIRTGDLNGIYDLRRTNDDLRGRVDNEVERVSPKVKSPNHYDWGEMPAVEGFVGRATEMAQLESWLVSGEAVEVPGARLVSILGMGGIGKTTLAAAVTAKVAPQFNTVIWRSLLNAPPLSELLSDWLRLLSRQSLERAPVSLDEQIRLLLDYLRQTRCLLVLDNVESIFTTGDTAKHAGETRAGYEGYAQLFQQVGGSDHASCLLLTSREQPYALLRLVPHTKSPSSRVRVLALTGLDLAASQLLIQNSGLAGSAPAVTQLINNYSGNPLALQLVAATINDFFAGDIAAFLQEDGMFFDGLRLVLDQQFARLSPLEHDILVWLAIEREAISVALLRSNLRQTHHHRAISGAQLLEALHSLQQRSLLEKSDVGLMLQNVILEYTTQYLVAQICQEISAFRESLPGAEGVIRNAERGTSFLNRFALLKACAKEYVRQSQARLILQPLAERLLTNLGPMALSEVLQTILAYLQQTAPLPGYAAGNLLNLFLQLGYDVRSYNFARLSVWQAYLCEATLYDVKFTGADLTGSNFRKPFAFIWSVVYSPDGQAVAGGSLAGAVFLWRHSDGQAIHVYQGHTALVYALAFSPDGQLLASGSEDKTICVWERQSGQRRYRLEQSGFVNAVAFSPDNTLLASASDDRTVRVWDARTGHAVQVLAEHRARVNSVAFHPAGKLLVSGSDDGSVQLWEVSTGRPIQRWVVTAAIYTVAFDPTGVLVVGSGEDTLVHCWELETGALRHTLLGHTDGVRAVAWSQDGALLASSGGDEMIRFWDVASGDCVRLIHAHQRCVTALSFSPDAKTIVSSSHDSTVCQWDVQTGRLLQLFTGYSLVVEALSFRPAGNLLAATLDNGQVRIWDVATGHPQHLLRGYSKEVQAIVFHPYQPLFVSGCADTYVRVWDLENGKQRWLCQGHTQSITAVAISNAGTRVASAAGDGYVQIWETQTAHPLRGATSAENAPLHLRIFCPAQRIFALTFSPDDRLLVGSSEQGIDWWDVASGVPVQRLPVQTLEHVALAFSADGTLLASGSIDHTISLWSVASGKLLYLLRNHHGTIYALAFSPDNRLLVSASGDHHLSLWDVPTGQLLHTYSGHQSRVLSVVFHPDGKRIASGSYDGVVKYWEVQSGACLETFYAKGPYAGMDITDVTGISAAQKASLRALGAVEK